MNIERDSNEISREHFDLIKCELCDDHIKRRYLEMKEHFFKIFKNYIKLLKLIKNKDEINLKKTVDEIKSSQKDFLHYRTLIEKLVLFRKISRSNSDNSKIKIEGLDEKEKKDFWDECKIKKDHLNKFRKNIIELETISKNIQDALESISMSNSIVNN